MKKILNFLRGRFAARLLIFAVAACIIVFCAVFISNKSHRAYHNHRYNTRYSSSNRYNKGYNYNKYKHYSSSSSSSKKKSSFWGGFGKSSSKKNKSYSSSSSHSSSRHSFFRHKSRRHWRANGKSDGNSKLSNAQQAEIAKNYSVTFNASQIPAYSDSPYVAVNDNKPFFDDKLLTKNSFEYYSPLDSKGRCGFAVASIGQDLMPTEKRGPIGSVKPSGWHTVKYNHVDGKYLYNRCHLIGYQLTAENANKQNLITGTRYLNVDGMLPFENMVADYVKETNNHILYRVTPIFNGDDLVAQGVLIEAKSVEDNGKGIMFNVFCYNVQPNVIIDYKTGDSHLS